MRQCKVICPSFVITILLTLGALHPGVTDSEENALPGFEENALPHPIDELTVTNITFDDTCYKGTDVLRPFEWWYFDAMFENRYSIEFHLIVASIKGVGLVVPMLNIYRDGSLVAHTQDLLPITDFSAHPNSPCILLQGNQFMEGYIDSLGNWVFNLSLHIDTLGVDLTYTSMTQGWKSNILGMWWWGVIQPKARVAGVIEVDNKEIRVEGIGYHEHGWDATVPYIQGWYWGKFMEGSLNIIWAYVMGHPWADYHLMVLNHDDGGYHAISPKAITITMINYTSLDGWMIPTSFFLQAADDPFSLTAYIAAQSSTHQISLAFFNYWRYHAHIQGVITTGTKIVPVDTYQIMDYTHIW